MDILQRALSTKNTPNIVLYSHKNVDKLSRLRKMVHDKYQLGYLKTDTSKFDHKYTAFYHEINMNSVTRKETPEFIRKIKDISERWNPYENNRKNLMVLTYYNHVKDSIQEFLRVVFEKYQSRTTFVVMSEAYSSIQYPIRSRFLCIRIPGELFEDGGIYRNISTTVSEIYENCSQDITNSQIIKLKEIAYNILRCNIDIAEICKQLCKIICSDTKKTTGHKQYICSYIANSERDLKNSYRTIIHLEGFLITLYDISWTAYYERLTMK
jgi:DNA polymerase III delta prime subunit